MCPALTGVMEGGHIVNRPQIAEFKGYLQDDLLFSWKTVFYSSTDCFPFGR